MDKDKTEFEDDKIFDEKEIESPISDIVDKTELFQEDEVSATSKVQELDEFLEPTEEIDDDDDDTMDSSEDVNIEATVESVIEAVLFASDEPLTKAKIVKIAELSSAKQVSDAIKNLNTRYRSNNNSFRIEKIAGGYQMLTLPIYNSWLSKMITVKTDSKLTQAALETLAIVAYKQPIIRADIEGVRGVASGEMVRSLMYKGLVKITGRAEILGRPLLYGTTKKFLEVFGLNSLKDLPSIEELKKPQQ